MKAIDENPQWSDDDFAKAKRAGEVIDRAFLPLLVRKPERHPMDWFYALRGRQAAYVAASPFGILGVVISLAYLPAGLILFVAWVMIAELLLAAIIRQ